jgi:cyclopropane fatty-acyl-phospholipid synthase-like methyltransferase
MEINGQHYDTITDAWPYMLGLNFHWGYFKSPQESLEQAQENLIEAMIDLGGIKNSSSLVDIGCGIGTPAFYLHEKYGIHITGLSNSPKGIQRANERALEKGIADQVRFIVRDALKTEIPNETMDHAWLMEMSHLLPNKPALIEEAARMVKKGGTVVLCDLMFQRPFTAREVMQHKKGLLRMAKAFGQAQIETIDYYRDLFAKIGLEDIQVLDISQHVVQTAIAWKENVFKNMATIAEVLPQEHINDFIFSCELLEQLYSEKIWGYGVISGIKK